MILNCFSIIKYNLFELKTSDNLSEIDAKLIILPSLNKKMNIEY